MKQLLLALGGLVLLAAAAEALVLALGAHEAVAPLAAFILCFTLVLAAFVALADDGLVARLRAWSERSWLWALGLPFVLLVPYFIFAFGTGTFTLRGAGKLAAYIAVPTLLLFPDRNRRAERVGWRDFAAMAALGVPVAANWLRGIWLWPEDLYFFRPLYSVLIGAYAFIVLRRLEGVGYKLVWQKGDAATGITRFFLFTAIAIPVGLALNFIHPHLYPVSPLAATAGVRAHPAAQHAYASMRFLGLFIFQFVGIYITIAIPEEFLFRGVLQNFLIRSFRSERREIYGLLIASVVFGASHLHHAPVPNWRYMILATIAGLFYGDAFRVRSRLSSSALTHALVDTAWHFWF